MLASSPANLPAITVTWGPAGRRTREAALGPAPTAGSPNMLASGPTAAAHNSPSARLTTARKSSEMTTFPSSFCSSPVRPYSDRARTSILFDGK